MADMREGIKAKFACNLCTKVFVNNCSLRRHVRNIHGECSLQGVKRQGRKVAESDLSFSCSVCSRSFTKKKSVDRHMRDKHRDAEITDNP